LNNFNVVEEWNKDKELKGLKKIFTDEFYNTWKTGFEAYI